MNLKKLCLSLCVAFALLAPCVAQTNSDYAKIPFEVQDGYILLSFNFSDTVVLKLALDTTNVENSLSQQGISKLNQIIGQDVYDWLRESIQKEEPELTAQQINERLQKKRNGKISLIKTNMKCEDIWFYNEVFFDAHASIFPGDGTVCLKTFKNAKNIVIDYKRNILEINAPPHKGDGVPMYELHSKLMYGYYILAELDGVRQPFIITTLSPLMIVRENTKDSIIYEGEELDALIKNNSVQNDNSEKEITSYAAEIKVGNTIQTFTVYKYSDKSLVYNLLGYHFFKNKCVQMDFEHNMLYVW